ncbi:Hypothetical predicted protein [Mytilus galloprovincialis]|uniref:Uncharacterized protein n=1 Tax=Mytilus galloprovincialis TaxID=29158 RepID=A0A8B6CIQ0_MYTGA|nr:Hypothetical predicted protein [Mytilus galloprovincialis]
MNLQIYRIHYRIQSDSSYKETAQNRMQHIWDTFIDGVKSLKDIALCLNEPIFDQRRLQKLSKNAEEKLNLAEQGINNRENAIKENIDLLVLKKQEYENEIKDLNSEILSLSHKTSIEENEVRRATDQVRIAERQVEEHTTQEFHALLKHALVTGGTDLLTRATVSTIGSPIGKLAAEFGRLTTAVTYSNLQNLKKDADEARMELQVKENMLTEIKATLNRIIEEKEEKKFTLNFCDSNHKKLLNKLKLTTRQKTCISQSHDYINITLGRVEILNERRKIKILIVNLKQCIEKVIEHLDDVQFLEGRFPIMQQLKCLTLEIHSLCIMHSEQAYVYFEGSFRACLVQISNSGCEAFMEAHKSMDKIRMYTMQFQENIRHMVNTLINGSDEERTQILPGMFEELQNDSDKCLHLAEGTEFFFHNVMLLIDETSEASAAVKGVYEDGLKEALQKMKVLQMEEKVIETRKQEMEYEKKRAIDDLEKAKSAFDKSLDQVPGVGKLLLMKTVEEGIKITTGAINLFGQYQMMSIATGVTALTSIYKGTLQETLKQSNKSEITTEKNNRQQPELKVAYRHAYKMHICIEKMYEMFQENIDSKGTEKMKVDLRDHEKALKEIRDALVNIKENYKRSEFAKDPVVLGTKAICKKGIELCEEMLAIEKKNVIQLFQRVEKLKSNSKGLQIKAQVFFKYSPLSIPSSEKVLSDQTTQSKRMIEIASENARYEVELRKKELDDTRKEREKFQNEVKKMDQRQNRNITSGIDICLSQKTYAIDKRLSDGRYSVGEITKDIVLQMAASVNTVAYAVGLVATAYTDISKKHLVPNTASLGELIAYDPATEGEQLDRKRRQIDDDCKEAKAEIKALAVKSREDLDKKIDDMYKRLGEQLNKLPSLPPAKVKEITENVQKSDMSSSEFNDLGF